MPGSEHGKTEITRGADYALVWHPPVEMLAGRDLKAVFALGAGVDSILSKLQAHPEMLKPSIPLFRPEDTGMGEQMQEYAVSQCYIVPDVLTIIGSSKMLRTGNRCLNIIGRISQLASRALACWAVKSHRVYKYGAFRCVAGVAVVNPARCTKLCWKRGAEGISESMPGTD